MPWWWELWRQRNDERPPDPEGWYLSGDEMRAQHPGIELFAVHPELGLEQLEDGLLVLPSDAKLGMRWMALTHEEQRLRQQDMLRALLQHAAAGDDSEFRAHVLDWDALDGSADDQPQESDWIERLCALDGIRRLPEPLGSDTAEGALTPAVIELLLALPPDASILVKRDGRRWCEVEPDLAGRGRHGVGAWLDPWHTGELERELSQAWWQAAEARRRAVEGRPLPAPRDGGRVSRETRAEAVVLWQRASTWVAVPAALLGGTLLPLPWLVGVLITFVVLLALDSQLGGALRRWHERS